ncbi:unnamed protein product [Amoebophrya sp. A120]|nr:unnamed protein product [Amoebophrya sp. A120]|eukprot:GSA120T00018130001.1
MSDPRGYHNCAIARLEEELETDCTKGVTPEKAAEKFARDGPNELFKPKPPTLFMLFIAQMLNVIMLLLSASACASLVIAGTRSNPEPIHFVEGIAIFVIVFLNAGIAAVTESVANQALEALSKMSQATCTVIRNGEEVEIDSVKVVVGDLVVLKIGDIVPADLRMLESNELKVNEMLLTGEPDDVAKKVFKFVETGVDARDSGAEHGGEEKLTPASMAFSSCQVTNGKAIGVVTDIGMATRVGAIALMLQSKKEGSDKGCLPDTTSNMTPLQQSLQDLGVLIGYLAIGVCALVFVVGWAIDSKDETDPSKESWLYMILVSVTLAVAAIPEGIPLCVTISLSSGANTMVQRNVLVTRLAAVETLGSASVICTDKTGTLTEGKMTLVKMWSAEKLYDVSGQGFDPNVGKVYPADDPMEIPHSISGINVGGMDHMPNLKKDVSTAKMGGNQLVLPSATPGLKKSDSGKEEPTVRSTLLAGLLCSNTSLSQDPVSNQWVPKGNSSEAPLVVAAAKVGFWEKDISAAFPRLLEIPFNSSRKMMLTISEVPAGTTTLGDSGIKLSEGTKYVVIVKGAPNIILDSCSFTCAVGDSSTPNFGKAEKSKAMETVDQLSSQALRVLAVAMREYKELPFDNNDDEISSDTKFKLMLEGAQLRLLGLFASIDPAREGVKEAVEAAYEGSIRVTMITGDYYKTAIAIARNIKILLPEDDVAEAALDCGGLRPNGEYLPEVEIDFLTSKVKVFARAKPEDKLEIVGSLQRQGLVCAMTGDGVNDAPALNKADIGIAMGIQGTDVAKGASSMILVDDNFVSIVGAVEMGRVIYAGIQKFVAFIMSVHIGEVMQIFFCVVAKIPIMRQPLQILFLILVTDLPPAVALGMEPGSATIMRDRPRPKKQPIVLRWMWMSIVINGLILSIVIAICYLLCLEYYVGTIPKDEIKDAIDHEDAFDKANSNCSQGMSHANLDPPSWYCACRMAGDSEDTCNDDSRKMSTKMRLRLARTATFVAVVYAENVRAYTSRSFDEPFFVEMFKNTAMQKAIAIAQIALYFVIFIPGLSDAIFELEGVRMSTYEDMEGETGVGYAFAFGSAAACVLLCELYKFVVKGQIREFARQLKEQQEAEEAERQRLIAAKEPLPVSLSKGGSKELLGSKGGSKDKKTSKDNGPPKEQEVTKPPVMVAENGTGGPGTELTEVAVEVPADSTA